MNVKCLPKLQLESNLAPYYFWIHMQTLIKSRAGIKKPNPPKKTKKTRKKTAQFFGGFY